MKRGRSAALRKLGTFISPASSGSPRDVLAAAIEVGAAQADLEELVVREQRRRVARRAMKRLQRPPAVERAARQRRRVAGGVAVVRRFVGDERALIGRERERDAQRRDRVVAERGLEQRRRRSGGARSRRRMSGGKPVASASGRARVRSAATSAHERPAFAISVSLRSAASAWFSSAPPRAIATLPVSGSLSSDRARPSQKSSSAQIAAEVRRRQPRRHLRPGAEQRVRPRPPVAVERRRCPASP